MLSVAEIPQHKHTLRANSNAANLNLAAGNSFAETPTSTGPIYSDASANLNQTLATAAVASVGGNEDHENMQPFLAVNFCIALRGLFPSRN